MNGTNRKIIYQSNVHITCMVDCFVLNFKVEKAIFYLDSPVSNSGRLKLKILDLLEDYSFKVEVQTITNVDSTLETLDNVITTDAIILDKCKSWINLNREIIEKEISNPMCVNFEFLNNII